MCKKNCILNSTLCGFKNGEYLWSSIDDSIIVNYADSVSTNVPANIIGTALTNFQTKMLDINWIAIFYTQFH